MATDSMSIGDHFINVAAKRVNWLSTLADKNPTPALEYKAALLALKHALDNELRKLPGYELN